VSPIFFIASVAFHPIKPFDSDEERKDLDRARDRAKNIDSSTGNPEYFVLLTDAISCYRGETPIVGSKREQRTCFDKKERWETRIIGVEAKCGPIDTVFFYTTDDMQCGGANVMVRAVWIHTCSVLFLLVLLSN
jgi:hypothetical protein